MKEIVSFVLLLCLLQGCGESTTKNNKDAMQLSQDSTALVTLFNKEIKAGDHILQPIPTKIIEFTNTTCRLQVTLPEDRNGAGAESLAIGKCTEAVKWLNENGYDLGLGGIYVSCYVYSPYSAGTTGREDMVTQWGNARYDTNTDRVIWKATN